MGTRAIRGFCAFTFKVLSVTLYAMVKYKDNRTGYYIHMEPGVHVQRPAETRRTVKRLTNLPTLRRSPPGLMAMVNEPARFNQRRRGDHRPGSLALVKGPPALQQRLLRHAGKDKQIPRRVPCSWIQIITTIVLS